MPWYISWHAHTLAQGMKTVTLGSLASSTVQLFPDSIWNAFLLDRYCWLLHAYMPHFFPFFIRGIASPYPLFSCLGEFCTSAVDYFWGVHQCTLGLQQVAFGVSLYISWQVACTVFIGCRVWGCTQVMVYLVEGMNTLPLPCILILAQHMIQFLHNKFNSRKFSWIQFKMRPQYNTLWSIQIIMV